VNCLHTLPVLGALEESHRDDPLVVIGVHSAKFPAEREPERIQEAMRRQGVRHPVVVDEGFTIWQSFAVRAWPTLVLIRPDGSIAGIASGEPSLEGLEETVEELLEEARREGTLAEKPYRVERAEDNPPGALAFPGKVIAMPGGGLAVSDSGHHRILLLEGDGRVRAAIGSGRSGIEDGPASSSRFTRPLGLATDGKTLYVADTGNHALRAIDLATLEVTTLAGDGTLARSLPRGFQPARDVRLRSPWDLALTGSYLLIAMAGVHQIWLYLPEERAIAVLAGTGAESIDDGDFLRATFSQPTGLAASGARVYVADSETSAVRSLDMDQRTVRTLVGKGLFDFGDVDGPPDRARLQHVQGVSVGRHGLLVADTYNDKIKRVDAETGEVKTWYAATGTLGLAEPGGLCQLEDGGVVVADTNRHRLLIVDGETRSARALEVREATPPLGKQAALTSEGRTLRIVVEPPAGFELTLGSVVDVSLWLAGALPTRSILEAWSRESLQVEIALPGNPDGRCPEVEVRVAATICYQGAGGACWPVEETFRISLPLGAEGSGARPTTSLRLSPPSGISNDSGGKA